MLRNKVGWGATIKARVKSRAYNGRKWHLIGIGNEKKVAGSLLESRRVK